MIINELYYISSIKGWSSCNHFFCNINETIVRGTADALVSTGLAAAGYQYGIPLFYPIYM